MLRLCFRHKFFLLRHFILFFNYYFNSYLHSSFLPATLFIIFFLDRLHRNVHVLFPTSRSIEKIAMIPTEYDYEMHRIHFLVNTPMVREIRFLLRTISKQNPNKILIQTKGSWTGKQRNHFEMSNFSKCNLFLSFSFDSNAPRWFSMNEKRKSIPSK